MLMHSKFPERNVRLKIQVFWDVTECILTVIDIPEEGTALSSGSSLSVDKA
jgi:hypothetical protein